MNHTREKESIMKMLELLDGRKLDSVYFFVLHIIGG